MRENFLSFLSSETYILIFFYVNLFQTSICPFCPLKQSYHFQEMLVKRWNSMELREVLEIMENG